ncbi:molecular chaperone [Desulfurivibrio sp. C05AmB]|jgi:putative dimethyl sulfoxide reductase chaperone|uniref:TorD/DmsD family molecular chaperone n=1 Tax=Desulfurivibrio sp. C05AmB TaxID=3374371 RepID=UPI00376EFC1B
MNATTEQTPQAHRAYIYQALSAIFYPPTAELTAVLEELPGRLEALHPELTPYASDLLAEFLEQRENLTTLQVDHAKLFLGPNELLAAPYGSVYLEDGRKIMGDTTINALEHYRAVGLMANQESKQPPDFIATELEFMFFLGHCYLQTGEAEYLERQRNFLTQHPGRWAGPFTEQIIAESETEFYKLLGVLTQKFIEAELLAMPAA